MENFLSFRDLTTISMVAAKSFKENQDSHVIRINSRLNLLKSAVIYGNNAGGKSNLLQAMVFMKATVLNSFREALMESNEKKFRLEKFALNTQTEQKTGKFEISFIHKGTKYRYGFEIDYHKIVSEWLFHSTGKEVYLFKRDHQKIKINKSAFSEGLGKEEDVKENVLFITYLATLGKEVSTHVIDWFKKFNFINGIHDNGNKQYTIDKLKSDKEFLNWVLHFIKSLEITNLLTTEEDEIDLLTLREEEKNKEIISLLSSLQKLQCKPPKRSQIITFHKKYDENNLLVESVPFNFDNQESEGTKKLLYLLGPWYDTLQNGKVLIIDELDARLHIHLTLRLINFFHQFNKSNAQLICAVHDISLLNKETFRRDQIWFVEKNQFGASELASPGDFKTNKVRNNSAFDKNYLEEKHEVIPYFDVDKKLTDLLYGNRKQNKFKS